MYSKYILIAGSCLLASVLARPSDIAPEKLQPTVIPIVSQSEELEPNGTYKFSYETGNGIKREEIAYEKIIPKSRDASSNEGGENDEESNEIHVQQGSYSYTAPDGTVITLRYIADENGFQPIGDHLPRAPVLGSAGLASAEKSGRALKIADSVDSASVPVEVKTVEKVSEPLISTPEEVKSAPLPVTEATAEEVKTEPIAVADESKVPTSEAKEPSAESEVKEAANVEVSTEVASTPAPALPTTGSEQDSNASAEQATATPEQSVVAEVTETTSSPSASEESSPSETVGQPTASIAANESPAEEVQQESTNAPEPASVEESSATTVSS